MTGHRYDPDRGWGSVGSNWYDDPDATHAMNDYSAAMRDLDPEADRPPFDVTDWRTADAQPTHPSWSCQGCPEHPAEVPDPWSSGGGWLGQHPSGSCRTGDPGCTGECGG